MALKERLSFALKKGVSKIQVEGDSRLVIVMIECCSRSNPDKTLPSYMPKSLSFRRT